MGWDRQTSGCPDNTVDFARQLSEYFGETLIQQISPGGEPVKFSRQISGFARQVSGSYDMAVCHEDAPTFKSVDAVNGGSEEKKAEHGAGFNLQQVLAIFALLHGLYCVQRLIWSGGVAAGFDSVDDRMDLCLYLVHFALSANPLFMFKSIPMRLRDLKSARLFKQFVLHRALFELSLLYSLWQCSGLRSTDPQAWFSFDLGVVVLVMVLAEIITHTCPTGMGTNMRDMTPDLHCGPIPPWICRKLLTISIIVGTTYYPLWRAWAVSAGQWTRRDSQLEFLSAFCITMAGELAPLPYYSGFVFSILSVISIALRLRVLVGHGYALQMLCATAVCVGIRFAVPRSRSFTTNIIAKMVPAALFTSMLLYSF